MRRDRHRVHPRVVQRVVAQHIAVTRERFFERIRRITRIIRTSIAIEVCSAIVFVVDLDVVYVTVGQRAPRREAMCSILEEDRAILRRVAVTGDLQRSWRDARLAIHERDVVVVQRIECTFRCIRESQRVVVAHGCRPLAIRAIQRSFIVIADRAKILEQRFFRIAVDQALARLGAVRVVVLRLIEWRTVDCLSIADSDRQARFLDFNRTCANEVVVDAGIFTILVQDTAESCRIVIRTGICRLTILLTICVVTTCSNGNLVSIDVIAIDKVRMILICCQRDVRVTIGLGSRATDIGITSEDFKRTIRCCNGIAFFASQILSLCVDNKVRTRIIAARSINVTIHTGLFFRSALTRKLDFARIAILQGAFLESRRESRIRNAVLAIAAREGSRCRRRVFRYVSRIAIDFRLIIGFDCDCRLYLEDVLVRIFRLSIRIEAVAALRAGVPAGCRLAVEVCAEIVAVWRCGVDFPVAAFAGLDGFLCRGQVLEGTICTACIDDNGIVFRRLSVQCTIIIGVIQDDCTVLTRRRQVDPFASLDAIDIDVARSLDSTPLLMEVMRSPTVTSAP